MNHRLKYLKYKKKYLNLKHSLLGGARIGKISLDSEKELIQVPLEDQMLSRGAAEDVRYQYVNEYDPKIFIDILIENDIEVTDHSKEEGFPSTAVHTSFEEVMELINKSCIDFINKVDKKKETIMLIPIFIEQSGSGLTKSNFWFSLLYLNLLINEFKFPIKDVVLIGKTASQYFIDLIDKPISFNVLLCDDGSYSGEQIIGNILPMVLGTKLNKSIVCNKINKVHFCLPFCSKICKELTEDEIIFRDEVKEEFIRDSYKYHGEGPYDYQKINDNEPEIADALKKDYGNDDLIDMIVQDNLNQYFGDFIHFHVGDKEFNKEMNHWFDHKIPDRHSLIPEHRPDSDVRIKEPYKKVWTIFGRKWNKNDELEYYRNSNKLLIDPNYTEELTLDILEFNEYTNLECTSTIGAYNIKIKEMVNLLMRTYGVFY